MSITDFETNIAKAQELADRLDGKNVDVQVRVDSAGAETKLAAVAASEDKVDQGNKKVASSSKDAGNGMGLMSMAIVGLGPAIVPLAAGAAGLAVGFGAMGAAGILALVGIKQQMAAGTPVGAAYTGMVGTLKGDLTTLGATAAAGVLAPFQKEVANLQGQMPALNGIIGEFSVITGKTAGNLMAGLVAAFIALEPLARDVGVYVLDLSSKFATLMSGSGVTAFGDYIRSVFPQVMATVESVVTAVVHLVAALAPMGFGTLGILRTFADLINAIPVDVLAVLAQGAAAVYIGFKTFGLAAIGVKALTEALGFLKLGMAGMLTAMGPVGLAAAAIATVVAVAAVAFTAHSESARKDQAAVDDLTDALIRSKGVIDQQIISDKADALAKDGTLAAAKALGYGIGDVTLASLGNLPATARVVAQSKLLQDGWDNNSAASRKLAGDTGTQTDAFDKVNVATKDGVKITGLATEAAKAATAAKASDTTVTTAASTAQASLASSLGMTVPALVAAQDGQKKTADATALAADKMRLENDAAGLLKTSLDILNGKALSLMESQTADADATNKAAESFKANGRAIDGNSTAAILNQQALQKKAEASQREAEAVGKATGSTVEATKAYGASKTALEDALRAQGQLTPAVQAYIDKLYDVKNLKIEPTKLDVDKAAAVEKIDTFQKKIDDIKQGKVPGLDANSAAGHATIAALQLGIDRIKQGKPPGVTADITPGQAQIVVYQAKIDAIKQKLATGLDANPKAAELQIIDMQGKIDAIKQKLATELDANNVPGKATVKSLQTEIDNIKQGKQPGLDADSAAGKAKVSDLQTQISGLQGKTVTVTVNADFSMGTGGANSMGYFTNAPGGADGGPVTGGTPGKDSVLRTLMPKEYIVRADGSNLADAAAYYGVAAPGMANGGVVGMLPPSLNPTRMNEASLAFLSGVHVNPAALGAGGSAGGAAQWAPLVSMVLAMLGQPASSLAGNLRRINFESGGNPAAINLTDSNAAAGHPSIGLMQTIMSTFLAYAGPFAGLGPTDALADIYAGDAYAIARYGSVAAVDPLVMPSGYDTGGMMMPGGVGKNYGTKAERWLSGDQTQWFEAGRAAAGKGGGEGGGNGATSADIAAVADEVRNLGQVIHAELQGHARTIQTMQRQMARA